MQKPAPNLLACRALWNEFKNQSNVNEEHLHAFLNSLKKTCPDIAGSLNWFVVRAVMRELNKRSI